MDRGTGALVLMGALVVWGATRPGTTAAQEAGATTRPATAPAQEAAPGIGRSLLKGFLDGGPASRPSRSSVDLTLLFATLPDPRASQLDWAFDSHLDGIRRAFERAGFVLDRFATPWGRRSSERIGLPRRPGALLFRATDQEKVVRLALVYLVGEVATSGIDRAALQGALAERRAMLWSEPAEDLQLVGVERERGVLRIVGPVFSGSCTSLRRVLDGERLDHPGAVVRIITGAATSPKNAAVLTGGAAGGITFESTLHTDETLMAVLETEVLPRLGLARTEVAILQESSTEYGAALTEPAYLRIPFPMSIAALRRAYVDHDPTAPEDAPLPGRTAPANVQLDLGATKDNAETLAPASNLTAATIDLLLEEATRTLAQRGIRAVLLFATDVRDKLFLGSELKKRLPDLQLLTTEGNALYVHPELNRWLRGMVVVSTYPMHLRSGAWRPQSGDRQLQCFPNEGAQGTFNAVLLQLGHSTALADYGLPVGQPRAEERPPVWVTVVGSGTMLPLVVHDPERIAPLPPPKTPVAARTEVGAATGARETGIGFLAVVVTSVLALLMGLILRIDLGGRFRDFAQRRRAELPLGGEPGEWSACHERVLRISLALHHEIYLALRYFALLGLLLPNVTLLGCAGMIGGRPSIAWLGVAGALAGVYGAVHYAVRAIVIAAKHRKEGWDHVKLAVKTLRLWWVAEFALRSGVALLGVGYLGVTILLCWNMAGLCRAAGDTGRGALFLQRTIVVDQGVSLLVPVMLLGVMLALWCQWHLQRIRLLADEDPVENALRRPDADRTVRDRLFLILPDAASTALLIVLGIGALAGLTRFSRALDDLVLPTRSGLSAFDLLLRLGILGAFAASIWASYRLVSVWRALRGTLEEYHHRLPDLPFAELQKELGSAPHASLLPSKAVCDLDGATTRRWSRLRELSDSRDLLGSEEASTPAARAAQLALVLQALQAGEDAVPGAGRSDCAPGAAPAWRARAAAVVAIELAGHVEWVLKHLRELSFFVLLSIVLNTLLISSYPYQPQQLIQTTAFLVFATVVVSLVWLIASMNRNPTLSRISHTPAGELTWDRTLYANLALYVAVPLFTLMSAQFPSLRALLFQWVEPLVRFLVTS